VEETNGQRWGQRTVEEKKQNTPHKQQKKGPQFKERTGSHESEKREELN